ncbi:MAG: DUF1330 domain-containing protein [Gammaproteobacteria bacterium]|nr:DUF1330 domain-containing protein [Gammaproteobacteria bacterium]
MAAFCFFDIHDFLDECKIETYRAGVLATVRQHQGRYRILGGKCLSIEGDWVPDFPLLIEFPDMARALEWYRSAEYRDLRRLRLEGARGDALFIECEPGEFIDG